MKNEIKGEIKEKDCLQFSVKAAGEKGRIEGYVSVYNVRDYHNEIVVPGAFAESLSVQQREGRYPLMLWSHDPSEPIGVWDDLADDGKGLYGKGKLLVDDNVPTADRVYSLVKHGAVQGLSIGYREVETDPAENGGPRKLKKLNLYEASVVSFPANRRARVEVVKSEKLVGRLEAFAQAVRDGEGPLPKEFEDILREAGVPKAMATQIVSVGYVKAIRREADGEEEANRVADALRAIGDRIAAFKVPS
jgi:HK97 family phage prohead protease